MASTDLPAGAPKRGRPPRSRGGAAPGAAAGAQAVRLAWTGRTWEPGKAKGPRRPQGALPFGPPVVEVVPGQGDHRLLCGDALDGARALAAQGLAGKVDLVYVDPPFASQADYVHEARLDGPADGRVVRTVAYADTWSRAGGDGGVSAYLEQLAPRLEALAGLLSPRGTMWIHLDWRAAYLVRVVLDEIFGRDRFVNEIVWRRAPNLGRQAASGQFGRTLDTLLVYAMPGATITPPTRLERIDDKAVRVDDEGRAFTTAPRGDYTDASIARLEKEGRVHRTKAGRVYVKYFLTKDDEGHWARERRVDALWTDVAPLRHVAASERTGFPTQKPRALLERIIRCATLPGDTVVDLFCGSGTTAEAAHAVGRRAIVGDAGALAVTTARARLLRAGLGLSLEGVGGWRAPPAPAPEVAVGPVHRAGAAAMAEVEVTLVSPPEPLAWAVGPLDDGRGGLRTRWHDGRTPGARPSPPARTARVPVREGEALAVRVFHDDGTVGERLLGPC